MEGSETEAGRRGHLVPSRHQQLGQAPPHTSLNTTMLFSLLPSLSLSRSLSVFDRLQCPVLQRWRDSQGVLMVNKESKRFPDSLEKSEGIDGWEECVERERARGWAGRRRERGNITAFYLGPVQTRRDRSAKTAGCSLQLQSNFNFAHLPHQMHRHLKCVTRLNMNLDI